MKLRRHTADFQVEEINALWVVSSGDHAVYRMRKDGWNTLDAISTIARSINVPRKACHHAGMKDRHAQTSQVITIRNGPQRDFEFDNISLDYLGQSKRAVNASDIAGNRFRIVVRSLSQVEDAQAGLNLPKIEKTGITNYFDDQRFRSYLPGHPFIAEHWIRGEYEQALWLTFAEHSPNDDSTERQQKAILRDCWNDWSRCKRELARSHRRSIVTFLDDRNGDFKGAWARVNADMRGLYLSAFQSHLWNVVVSEVMKSTCPPESLSTIRLKTGSVFTRNELLDDSTEREINRSIHLPSERLRRFDKIDQNTKEIIEAGLKTVGWSLEEIKVRYPRDRFFSRGTRETLVFPEGLKGEFADDEKSLSLRKLTLDFTLPRGSYATMLIKHIIPKGLESKSQMPT